MTETTRTRDPGPVPMVSRVRAAVAAGAIETVAQLESLPRRELRELGEALASVRREVDVMLASVGQEVARRSQKEDGVAGHARKEGYQNPEKLIADQLGGSMREARRLIKVGQVVAEDADGTSLGDGESDRGGSAELDGSELPPRSATGPEQRDGASATAGGDTDQRPRFVHVARAAKDALISVEAAHAIMAMLERVHGRVDPERWRRVERALVEIAQNVSFDQLARAVRREEGLLHAARLREREEELREQRYLSIREDSEGMVHLSGKLDVESAAPLIAAIDGMVAHTLRQRRDRDVLIADTRTVPQVRADALTLFAQHVLKCENDVLPLASTTVVVRIGLAELTEGVGEVDGCAQPMTAGAIRRLAADGGVIPTVLGRESEVLDLGRGVRLFTKAQKTALVERDGGCAMCFAPPSWCEAHHIRPWHLGGTSDLSNGVMLCTRCHHQLHRDGWEIDATPTEVWVRPPASVDPRRRRRRGGRARFHVTEHPGLPPSTTDDAPSAAPHPNASEASHVPASPPSRVSRPGGSAPRGAPAAGRRSAPRRLRPQVRH